MARIGTYDITVFRGYMPNARRRSRLNSHDGVNGDGVVFDAYHTGTVEITTRVLVPATQAKALRDQYSAQQEKFLTVIDQFGDQYTEVLVVDVAPQRELVIGDEAHVVCSWTLLPQTIPPAGAS
jgi:hypothetical protein